MWYTANIKIALQLLRCSKWITELEDFDVKQIRTFVTGGGTQKAAPHFTNSAQRGLLSRRKCTE